MIHVSHRVVTSNEAHAHCKETVTSGVRLSEANLPSSIRFARKRVFQSRSVKDSARARVLEVFRKELRPTGDRPYFFTMPGMHWDLEKNLIGIAKSQNLTRPRFFCVEHDPAIFMAALDKIPKKKNKSLYAVDPFTFRSSYVSHYRLGKAEEMVGENSVQFSACWLDFCGPLSIARLGLLDHMFSCSEIVALTVMKGRYDASFREIVRQNGTLLNLLKGRYGEPEDIYEYGDGAAMLQLIWKKVS